MMDRGIRASPAQPLEGGEVAVVQRRGAPSDVLVNEHVAGGPLLGGWLRLDGDDATLDLPMPGREVALAFDRPGRLVRLSVEGPAHSGGALPTVSLAAVDTGGQVRLWLPDEASALLVDRGSGAPLRVPLQGGETSLSVRLP